MTTGLGGPGGSALRRGGGLPATAAGGHWPHAWESAAQRQEVWPHDSPRGPEHWGQGAETPQTPPFLSSALPSPRHGLTQLRSLSQRPAGAGAHRRWLLAVAGGSCWELQEPGSLLPWG